MKKTELRKKWQRVGEVVQPQWPTLSHWMGRQRTGGETLRRPLLGDGTGLEGDAREPSCAQS